jgi:hypothetical protein
MNPVDESSSSIEEKIRAAIARGEFDNLPGAGKPLQIRDNAPGWWARQLIERMRAEDAQAEFERALVARLAEAWLLPDEAAVRCLVGEINQEIAGTSLSPLDPAEVVTDWRRMARLRRR